MLGTMIVQSKRNYGRNERRRGDRSAGSVDWRRGANGNSKLHADSTSHRRVASTKCSSPTKGLNPTQQSFTEAREETAARCASTGGRRKRLHSLVEHYPVAETKRSSTSNTSNARNKAQHKVVRLANIKPWPRDERSTARPPTNNRIRKHKS